MINKRTPIRESSIIAMLIEFPQIFILPTRLSQEELHSLEESLPSLTYDINEAEIIVGKIAKRDRALFELRRLKLTTEDANVARILQEEDELGSPLKRRKLTGIDNGGSEGGNERHGRRMIKVVRMAWLTDSLSRQSVLPTDPYLVYAGFPSTVEAGSKPETTGAKGVLERAAQDMPRSSRVVHHHYGASKGDPKPNMPSQHPPALLHQTTSEHDMPLPLLPDWMRTPYACQRPTHVRPLNAAFIEELRQVRVVRQLQGDGVGERAYGKAIAVLAAYPYLVQTALEVARLPGCGGKIAELWAQWKESGQLNEVAVAAADSQLTVLKVFYEIWGVGDSTARELYKKGWRDLDDIVEFGWASLSRVQQIGVKYYDEFQLRIPRSEVESIGDQVLSCARKIHSGFQMVIVGGYRRGKSHSGDADILLSHPDEAQTMRVIDRIVIHLEKAKLITHTLTLSTKSSERGQAPLPWKGVGRNAGSGFDTLDKALVVWQDKQRPGAPHRRVDIIISAWKTVGCAVLGWSGANTFERDLRLYCKQVKGLKFDSSGIRSRVDGSWVDLEGDGSAPDMETAEKRVFEGLGIPFRSPEERCTD